jgi:hypothetical protein
LASEFLVDLARPRDPLDPVVIEATRRALVDLRALEPDNFGAVSIQKT